MSDYVDAIRKVFTSHTDSITAIPMKAYMRNQFEFLGIKSPRQRELLNIFIAEYGLPSVSDLSGVLLDLWDLPEREFQYAGMNILEKLNKKTPSEFIETIETLITSKSWWDTVDALASKTVGTHFRRFPEARNRFVGEWRKSDNIWLRRTCLLFQLKYKEETDFELLCSLIRENQGSNEFFINKAIGWALRQYSKVNGEAVRVFVAKTQLHPLSAREALKWLEKHK